MEPTTCCTHRHRRSRWLGLVPFLSGAGTIDVRWFAEDRKLPKAEQADAIAESKKALSNATLLNRRLKVILEEMIEKTYTSETDYKGEDWERRVLTMFAKRETLKEVIKLLP